MVTKNHSFCIHFEIIDYLCKRNMTKEELQKIIAIDEGFRIELTKSKGEVETIKRSRHHTKEHTKGCIDHTKGHANFAPTGTRVA